MTDLGLDNNIGVDGCVVLNWVMWNVSRGEGLKSVGSPCVWLL